MMHGFQQIVAQAECRYNFVVHGLSPLGDEMAVSLLIWRKRLMDSISSNLGYYGTVRLPVSVHHGRVRGVHRADLVAIDIVRHRASRVPPTLFPCMPGVCDPARCGY